MPSLRRNTCWFEFSYRMTTSSLCINNSCVALPHRHVGLLKQEHKHSRNHCTAYSQSRHWYAWMHAATRAQCTPSLNTQTLASNPTLALLRASLCQRKMPSIMQDAWGERLLTFLPIMAKLLWMALIFGRWLRLSLCIQMTKSPPQFAFSLTQRMWWECCRQGAGRGKCRNATWELKGGRERCTRVDTVIKPYLMHIIHTLQVNLIFYHDLFSNSANHEEPLRHLIYFYHLEN